MPKPSFEEWLRLVDEVQRYVVGHSSDRQQPLQWAYLELLLYAWYID